MGIDCVVNSALSVLSRVCEPLLPRYLTSDDPINESRGEVDALKWPFTRVLGWEANMAASDKHVTNYDLKL